jgi:hypothetical protein
MSSDEGEEVKSPEKVSMMGLLDRKAKFMIKF